MGSYSGWLIKPFKTNRPLNEAEQHADLRRSDLPRLDPLNKGAIRLDATCLEYLDRYFLVRGMAVLGGGIFSLFCTVLGVAGVYGFLQSSEGAIEPVFWGIAIVAMMCGIPTLFAFKFLVLKDAFRYTHYPVRFNRVTRMVYIFTGKRQKILQVPFDEAHFFIHEDGGTAANAINTYDLRMHVLKDDLITHTVSIGSDGGGSPGIVLAHWEMIRRFMDERLGALPFPPLGLFASSHVSLKNAFIIPFAVVSGPLQWVVAPFIVPVGIARYIALATSRRPVWPKDVDAACAPPAGGRCYREPLLYGDLPGGETEEKAFAAYWSNAEAQARAQDAALRHLFR